MIHIKKVVTLPDPLEPNTVYLTGDATETGLVVVVTGATGNVVRKTSSLAEIMNAVEAYVATEIAAVVAMIPVVWESIQYDHGGSWGSTIYVRQTSGTSWRIKRITGAGIVSYSRDTDPSNSTLTQQQAWDDRANLVYS